MAPEEEARGRRYVVVEEGVIRPTDPKPYRVVPRLPGDYPQVPKVYLDAAQALSSPLLSNPPLCDELLAFVQHLWTEEEASLVRHLHPFRGRSCAELARAEGRPVAEVEGILHRLETEKRSIGSSGSGARRRYRLKRILGQIFEETLMGHDPENLSDWHKRFIVLWEDLFMTGWMLDYQRAYKMDSSRVVPLSETIQAIQSAMPYDKLETIMERYDRFAVTNCQCRMSAQVLGKGCGKPISNCLVMGEWVDKRVNDGWYREVSRKDALEIKAEAAANGLVSWVINIQDGKGQASCSCCACCCYSFRLVTEFACPSVIAPPHFIPSVDASRCTFCGKCAKACPIAALTVDTKAKEHRRLPERCIGCGLCAVTCAKAKAVTMVPAPDHRRPPRNMFSLIAGQAPGMLKSAWQVSRKYRRGVLP
ncbi:MAG: 4Fe-4S binding protein [Actinobacteria bacterium]|nr:4Fe-4S binding protein [Actinomycetota bacterium]